MATRWAAGWCGDRPAGGPVGRRAPVGLIPSVSLVLQVQALEIPGNSPSPSEPDQQQPSSRHHAWMDGPEVAAGRPTRQRRLAPTVAISIAQLQSLAKSFEEESDESVREALRQEHRRHRQELLFRCGRTRSSGAEAASRGQLTRPPNSFAGNLGPELPAGRLHIPTLNTGPLLALPCRLPHHLDAAACTQLPKLAAVMGAPLGHEEEQCWRMAAGHSLPAALVDLVAIWASLAAEGSSPLHSWDGTMSTLRQVWAGGPWQAGAGAGRVGSAHQGDAQRCPGKLRPFGWCCSQCASD